jgi:hypothetical protein
MFFRVAAFESWGFLPAFILRRSVEYITAYAWDLFVIRHSSLVCQVAALAKAGLIRKSAGRE